MSISIEAVLGPYASALSLRAERMGVLANNVAHADTPGYQARDMDFKAQLNRQLGENSAMRLRTSASAAPHPSHLPIGTTAAHGGGVPLKYRIPLMPSADSNTVDVQVEQAALAENNIQFQAAYRFLNGRITGLMTAIKGE